MPFSIPICLPFVSCSLPAIEVIRMKFNSPPTEQLNDLEYHLTHPEKTDESGLLKFIVQQMADGFRIFLEEGQFVSGNALYVTVVLKGTFTLSLSIRIFSWPLFGIDWNCSSLYTGKLIGILTSFKILLAFMGSYIYYHEAS